jgi:hypothetical protein
MPAVLEKELKAVSIEYLPVEEELDRSKPLQVGIGMSDKLHITEDLTSIEIFGVKRYKTGLDPEVVRYDTTLTDQEKEIKIAQIEENVKRLEKLVGPGQLDATNSKFWSKVKLQLDRKTTNLDLTDFRKEILFHCIKAGGFETVAPSLEEAQSQDKKFYLIEPVEFVENRVSPRKIFNDAIYELQRLDRSKSFDDMFYVAKYLMPVERAYTKRTPKSLMYEDLDKFLKGENLKSKRVSDNASQFMDALKLTKDILIVTDMVKDGIYFGMLYQNQAGELKNNETGGIYGNTVEAAVKHLLTPSYEHELENLKSRIIKKWSE